MDTKLKNMTKTQKEWMLLVGWLLVGIMATIGGIYYSYYMRINDCWMIPSYILVIGAIVLGILLLCFSVKYIKDYPPKTCIQQCKLDRVKTEILVLLLAGLGWKWLDAFQVGGYRGYYVWSQFRLDHTMGIILFTLVLILFLGSFLTCLVLLLRQYILGIMPETSIIWKEILRRKNQLSLEEKIYASRKNILKFAIILIGFIWVSVFISILTYYIDAVWGGIILLCSICLLAVVYWCGISKETLHEMACLVHQIEKMSSGEEITDDMEIPEDSILFEASHQLKNIDSAMRVSIKKQVQAEKMKVDLITNVSHDLKTPLTSMIGYTDLLKKEELSAEAKDYVEIISLKQEKLKDMIQNLFELSKATSGVDLLTIETLDMRKLLEQTLGDMEDAIRENGREIRTKFPEEPLLFKGDNEKMYRVVQNLLENALKYSMEGTRIYLDIRRESNRIYTEIKNIASYEMDFAPEEIMERFVRGDESRSTEGHGLGLAIASSFVRNMDGMMDIEIDGDLFKVILNFPVVQE